MIRINIIRIDHVASTGCCRFFSHNCFRKPRSAILHNRITATTSSTSTITTRSIPCIDVSRGRECTHRCLLIIRDTALVDLSERSAEKHIQGEVLPQPVVCASTVLVVISPNLLRARPSAYLCLAQTVLLTLLLLPLCLVQPSA